MADFYLHHLVIHPLDPLDEGKEEDKIEAEEDVQDKTLEEDEDCQENEDGDIQDETLEEAGDLQEDEDSLVAFVIDYLHKGEALLESGYKVGVWRSGFRIIDLRMLFKVKKISFTFDAFMPYEEEGNTEEPEKPIKNKYCERDDFKDVINGEEQDDEAKTEDSDIDLKGGVEGEEIDEDDDGEVLLFFVEMVSPVDEQEKEEAILQLAHLRTAAPKVLVKFLESKLTIIH